jgi:hypothetical protein
MSDFRRPMLLRGYVNVRGHQPLRWYGRRVELILRRVTVSQEAELQDAISEMYSPNDTRSNCKRRSESSAQQAVVRRLRRQFANRRHSNNDG